MAQVVVIEKVRDLIAISSRGGRHGVGSARHQTDIGRVTWIGAFKNKLIDDEARREQKSRSRQPWKIDHGRGILAHDETGAGGEDRDFILISLSREAGCDDSPGGRIHLREVRHWCVAHCVGVEVLEVGNSRRAAHGDGQIEGADDNNEVFQVFCFHSAVPLLRLNRKPEKVTRQKTNAPAPSCGKRFHNN